MSDNQPTFITRVRSLGLGAIIAFLVLIACFVLWLTGKPLDPAITLILIAMLALARLL